MNRNRSIVALFSTVLLLTAVMIYLSWRPQDRQSLKAGFGRTEHQYPDSLLDDATPTRQQYIIRSPVPGTIITPLPGEKEREWLYVESDAIEYAKSVTNTDTWNDHAVRRTTYRQLQYLLDTWVLFTVTPGPISMPEAPAIEDDNSPALWVVAFENSERMRSKQIYGFLMMMPDEDPNELIGKKAYIAFDELGNAEMVGTLDQFDNNGNAVAVGPSLDAFANLPEVPGTKPTP